MGFYVFAGRAGPEAGPVKNAGPTFMEINRK
jgi:hypothetical protein